MFGKKELQAALEQKEREIKELNAKIAEYQSRNDAVVSAICSHTTGKADMNTLEKIIYVADYMEPNRAFDGVEELRRLACTDLDGALKMGLEMTLEVLRREGREISPSSREALAWLAKQ